MAGFCYIWNYEVKAEAIARFREAYEADGDWVQLFRQHPGYIRTELLRDIHEPSKFITIDYWKSRTDRDDFRRKFSKEFEDLDKICEGYTVNETLIGDFDIT